MSSASVPVDAATWEGLRGGRIFLTGGTGFFGRWLLQRFLDAERRWDLRADVVVLSRDPGAFRRKCPELANAPRISFVAGDVRDFAAPLGRFTHMIHAATDVDPALEKENPAALQDVIVRGTRRVLDFATGAGAGRFLYVSSGAVYGRQRPDVERISEDDPAAFAPLARPTAYALGKRAAEALCVEATKGGPAATIARGFAFVGPTLSLDAHFAIGNFIRDALSAGDIRVNGDGTPYRSYLYGSDLADWLWTILLKGAPGRAYNVGSERAVSVAELARLVAGIVAPGAKVLIARAAPAGQAPEHYVPSTVRARTELGLRETVGLEESVRLTADWARAHAGCRNE